MPPVCPICNTEITSVGCACALPIGEQAAIIAGVAEATPIIQVVLGDPIADLTKKLEEVTRERNFAQAVMAQMHDQEWIGRTVHHLQSLKMRATGFHGPNDRCGESIPNMVGMPYPCGALIGGKQRFCNRCAPTLVSWDALPWQMKEGYSTSMVELLERTESYVKSKMDAKSDTA